jgi:transketolase
VAVGADEIDMMIDLGALLAAGQQHLHLTHLAVGAVPGSGTGEELLAWAGIDAGHIAAAARKLMGA